MKNFEKLMKLYYKSYSRFIFLVLALGLALGLFKREGGPVSSLNIFVVVSFALLIYLLFNFANLVDKENLIFLTPIGFGEILFSFGFFSLMSLLAFYLVFVLGTNLGFRLLNIQGSYNNPAYYFFISLGYGLNFIEIMALSLVLKFIWLNARMKVCLAWILGFLFGLFQALISGIYSLIFKAPSLLNLSSLEFLPGEGLKILDNLGLSYFLKLGEDALYLDLNFLMLELLVAVVLGLLAYWLMDRKIEIGG